ncbi:MAG: bifunctional folylpolyglutamate synthase/dihydrofolate synthase [Defluviitaleaceae bacterium]|nr:bifunctional folylpolyglutamate synthase/dihydrofolate synthase [Defluviitaleaceae bacterium]
MKTAPPITTMEDALAFIYRTSWKGSQLGLSRMEKLMALLGNPQKKLKFVHIAGTNGKGSTAAMLASVLAQAGYKTGLYTSPVVHNFEERMQVNGVPVTPAELIAIADHFQKYVDMMDDPPTEFEVITAMSIYFFYRKQCDIVVLEVGMGGRLDATNVIDTPEVAVITSIGLDHMAELGNTPEKIAGEKAGIIKTGGVAVCHPQSSAVAGVIREKCKAESTAVTFVDDGDIVAQGQSLDGQRFDYGSLKGLEIPLLGKHQLHNAAVVIETVKALRGRGWHISDDALRCGLQKTQWPGRFEVMRRDPVFIVDSAHNPQGVQSTLDTLRVLFPSQKFVFLFGVLADKDYAAMLDILMPFAACFITVTPSDPRGLPAAELNFCACNVPVTPCETIAKGVQFAIETAEPKDVICALGSLSMVGQLRECLLPQ